MKQLKNLGITNSYGYQLSEKLRTETKDFNSLGDYERFALKEGYLYDTEPKLKAAYERLQKALNGELLTKEEFDAEIQSRFNGKKADILYLVLTDLVNKKILDPARVYDYARFGWCMNTPEALVYYQVDVDKFDVNNCGTQITMEEAIVKTCMEWGFEASRIKIVGTPYYDATDWQFIRFDCAGMAWLWAHGTLYMVYL